MSLYTDSLQGAIMNPYESPNCFPDNRRRRSLLAFTSLVLGGLCIVCFMVGYFVGHWQGYNDYEALARPELYSIDS